MKRTAERIAGLESSDEDRWSNVAYLCNTIEKLEQNYRKIEKEISTLFKKIKDKLNEYQS